MTAHNYSNTASVAQVGTGGIDSSADTLPVNLATFTGYPSPPFWIEVGQGTSSAEVMEVTAVAGSNLTVNRGQGGTSGTAHNAGDTITHIIPAGMAQDAEAHEAATTGVHGTTGSVVGTGGYQTLTDKAVRGTVRYAYSDANPPTVTAAVQVDADNPEAKDAVVVNNTAADGDQRAFLLEQSGTPRVQVFMDGTVDINPSGTSRPGFYNHGTTELDGAITVNGNLTTTGTVNLSGSSTTTTALTAQSGTISGNLNLPLPASGSDVNPRIVVNANSGQPVFQGQLNGSLHSQVDAGGNARFDGNTTLGADLSVVGNATIGGSLVAQGNKLFTYTTNSGDVSVRGHIVSSSTDVVRNLRQPVVWGVRNVNLGISVTSSDTDLWSVLFTPRDDCEIAVDLTLHLSAPPGASGNLSEPVQADFGYKVTSPDGTSTFFTSDVINWFGGSSYHASQGAQGTVPISEITVPFTGGTQYKLVLHGSSATSLKPTLNHILGKLTETVHAGWLVNG